MPNTHVTRGEFESWRRRAAWFYLGLGLVCTLAIVLSFRVATDGAKERLRTVTEQSCDRGNVVRAYLIVDAGQNRRAPVRRQRAALRLLPILNCSPLGNGKPPVPMARAEADAYISALATVIGVDDWWAPEG